MRDMSINFHGATITECMRPMCIEKISVATLGNILSLSSTIPFIFVFKPLWYIFPLFRSPWHHHSQWVPTRHASKFISWNIQTYLPSPFFIFFTHGKCPTKRNLNVPTAYLDGVFVVGIVVLKTAELLSFSSQKWIVFFPQFLLTYDVDNSIKVSVIVWSFCSGMAKA